MEEIFTGAIVFALIVAAIFYALPYVGIAILCLIGAFIIGAIVSACGAPDSGSTIGIIVFIVSFLFFGIYYFVHNPMSIFTEHSKSVSTVHAKSASEGQQNQSSANCTINVSYGKLANIRSGTGTRYPVLLQEKSGFTLHVLGATNGWYKVDIGNGQIGWINKSICK